MLEKYFNPTKSRERPERKSLEEQFKRRKNFQVDGSDFKIVDISAENKKTDTPLVMAPGWAASPETFKENILSLAESGRRVMSVDEYHGIPAEKSEDYSHAQKRKAKALFRMLEQTGIEKADVFAHSEGAIYVAMAAMEHPEKFRNLVLVCPGGMIGEDNRIRLTTGAIMDLLSQRKNKYTIRGAINAGKSIVNNPKAAVEEIFGIAQSQIEELLKMLKAKGIGISIVHGVDDKFFPMELLQKIVKREIVDGFYSVKGTHNQIYLQPKEYTKLIDSALDKLEMKLDI